MKSYTRAIGKETKSFSEQFFTSPKGQHLIGEQKTFHTLFFSDY
jgi:hypothetical protein